MRVDRRSFLSLSATAIGGAALLAACGSDDASSAAASTAGDTSASTPPKGFTVVGRFPNTDLTPGSVRLPVCLASPEGYLLTSGPASITGSVLDAAGKVVATFETASQHTDIVNPYWPVRLDLTTPGIYSLHVDGASSDNAFQIFEPGDVATPALGAKLPGFDTPTTTDARGVDPICTLTPNPCPFHTMTLTDALASGKPIVYMVGTPAHCQFATCGPGLEFLIAASKPYLDTAVFLHAEVYTDNTATTVAPAVDAIGLTYEPVVYFTDATGKIVDRLDVIWDEPEMVDTLKRNLT